MSDQTSASGEPEENDSGPVRPRQSAAERRASETVMLNADNLDDLVAQAKATPAEPAAAAPEPTPAAAEPAASPTTATDGESSGSRQILLIIGVVVIVILAIVIAWLIYK